METQEYRDRSLIISAIGVLLLFAGIAAAIIGPIEIYTFYLFSEGGKFHYPGFGFGSFMFGNIATQVITYYVFGIVFIPLGYAHIAKRRWARTISITLFWFWLVVGLPLVIVFFLMTITAKALSPPIALVLAVGMGLSYFLLPWFFIRFYQSRDVRLTFESKDPNTYGIERIPFPILVLCALYIFYILGLHVPLFFNALFPLFGSFLIEILGFFLVDFSIMLLVILAWGTLKQKPWAWWGSLVYFLIMALSTILTFAQSSYLDILSGMKFPPAEIDILDGIPLQGYHLAIFFGLPLLFTLGTIIYSKRYFNLGQSR